MRCAVPGPRLDHHGPGTRPWHLYLTWGVLVAQGLNLIGFVPHLTQMALWFRQRRGLASGLVLSGASIGALVSVPGTQY